MTVREDGRMCRHVPRISALLAVAALVAPIGVPAQSLGTAGPQIGLKNLRFDPSKAKGKVGQQITFVWKEKVAHNVVFEKDGPKSKIQSKGTWMVKFAKRGTYKYKCSIHPGMKGEISVS